MSRTLEYIRKKAALATISMPLPEWNWSEGVALYGLVTLWKGSGEEKVLSFIRTWVDRQLKENRIYETVNATAPCFTLAELYALHPEEKYKEIINSRVEFLMNKAPRIANGAFEHTLVETKFNGQIWVDTLFMAGLFLVKAGLLLHIPEAVEEGIRQYHIHGEKLQQENGLFYHGWDEGKGRNIGCLWARGNAWAVIVSVELLEMLPQDHKARGDILTVLARLVEGLMKTQDISGLWTTVLTEQETYLETSAAAGIAYGIEKGIRLGIIDSKYSFVAERGIRGVLAYLDWDGILRGVSAGTGVQSHPGEYHVIARDRLQGYGQGLLLMMLSEVPDGMINGQPAAGEIQK